MGNAAVFSAVSWASGGGFLETDVISNTAFIDGQEAGGRVGEVGRLCLGCQRKTAHLGGDVHALGR